METPDPPSPSAYDSDGDVDEMLEQHDTYIRILARQKVPRTILPSEVVDLEIDDLAQRARIKLWHTSLEKSITNPKAYIQCIVHSESVDMLRRHKPILPLPIDEDGELYFGSVMVMPSEGMQDPADELEREEVIADYITKLVDGVLALPPRQRHAMMCFLKEQIANSLPLIEAFRSRGVNIEEVILPRKKEEVLRNRVLLSLARKKLRSLKGK
jgi:DNA-directed RNA polymerase specialized sigma24 family protein